MCTNRDVTDDSPMSEICEEGLSFYAEALRRDELLDECPECLLSLGLLRRIPGQQTFRTFV